MNLHHYLMLIKHNNSTTTKIYKLNFVLRKSEVSSNNIHNKKLTQLQEVISWGLEDVPGASRSGKLEDSIWTTMSFFGSMYRCALQFHY